MPRAISLVMLSLRKRRNAERSGFPATSLPSQDFSDFSASRRRGLAGNERFLQSSARRKRDQGRPQPPLDGSDRKSRIEPRSGRWPVKESVSCRGKRRQRDTGRATLEAGGAFSPSLRGCLGQTNRNVSWTSASFSAQPPHPRLRSPRQFTTRSDSCIPSMSERRLYQRNTSFAGRRPGLLIARNIAGFSRAPTIRMSRSMIERARSTTSITRSRPNALDNEWDVDNCAPILKGCPMSPRADVNDHQGGKRYHPSMAYALLSSA